MLRHQLIRAVLVLLAIENSFAAPPDQATLLGILEEHPGHYSGEPNYRAVRVVFEKKAGEWQAFPNDCQDEECLRISTQSYPAKVRWTISLDGKRVGQVTSQTPSDFKWYSDVGQQEITSRGAVPTIGEPSPVFGGFTEANVYRPLIANSQPYFHDPDIWKPGTPPPELTQTLRRAFRHKFPKLCRANRTDESKLESFPYRDEDVQVVKSYASRTGWIVARMHLEAIDCKDTDAGFDMGDPWFVVDPAKSVSYLG